MGDEEKPGEKLPTHAPNPPPQEVLDKLKETLDKLPELPEHVRVSVAEAVSFSGPLPTPTTYGEYERVLPGSAERILAMAEKEQSHRIGWETEALGASRQETERGQWLGFTIAVGYIGAATFLAVSGQEVVAGIMALGGGVGIVVGHFLKR